MKDFSINNKYKILIFIFCLVMVLSGCAIRPMAFVNTNIDTNKESIAFFTLSLTNQYKPSLVPEVLQIQVRSQSNNKIRKFQADKGMHDENSFCIQFISLSLPAGNYTLENVSGFSKNILIYGKFKFPIGYSFEVMPNSIQYLGNIVMTNRKAEAGEQRSGSIFPLVDQAVCGFSTGTFDVSMSDQRDSDIKSFFAEYPFLKNYNIISTIFVSNSGTSNQNTNQTNP
jgi:hypothetical protein